MTNTPLDRLPLLHAEQAREAATARINKIQAEQRRLEVELAVAITAERDAEGRVMIEQAKLSREVFQPGQRVQHRRIADVVATVVPSDGRGLSIRQDGSKLVAHGHDAADWVAI